MAARRLILTTDQERARQVLNLAMRMLGQTDAAVAANLGKKYQAVQQRRHAETRIRHEDYAPLANALGIEPHVFEMEPREAGEWILTNCFEQVIAATGWFSVLPASAANLAGAAA